MFEALRHQLMSHGTLVGQIQSHEGDIYIARLINQDGDIIETCRDHFSSLINARDWLQQHGVTDIQFQQSPAYFEMINNTQEIE